MLVHTIGHSTRSLDELAELLKEAEVDLIVDVRTIPRSRTNPQFNADAMPEALRPFGIGYRHLAALGGLRGRRSTDAPSPNTLWRNTSFRNYADYAAGPAFREGLASLKTLAGAHRCAIMCAEAVWWRCHRRIIADYLLADGIPVRHILGPGKIEEARMTSGARRDAGGALLYAASEDTRLL